jgi:protein-disulfide isomerase
VADREITLAEVDEHALGVDAGTFSGLPLRLALFESRRRALDELVAQELFAREARTRGVKPDALVQQEVLSRVAAVQDSEIEAWYRDNPDRVRGASLEQVRETIRQYLRQQRVNQASAALIARLKAATRVEILLEPPRVSVSVPEGAPTLGPAQAPVQIVEFSDFQCPYCAQVAPVLRALPGTYGDKVRIIFRNFPLVIHPQAVGAAEAAQCAHVQGKFWEYHDRLFANQQALGPDDLKRQAATVGLDASAFGACLDGHTFAGAVEADAREAQRYGVSATPTFFINGRFVSGALSREAFQQIIDEELGRAGK